MPVSNTLDIPTQHPREPSPANNIPKEHWAPKLTLTLMLLFLFSLFIKAAWVNEDAYISFRTVDNLLHGHGLTWNISERVQAYTNPLWTLVVACAASITHEIFLTVIVLQLLLSITAVLLVTYGMPRSQNGLLIGLVGLICSKAFIDYTTSGMENPLSFLLLALYAWGLIKTPHKLGWLTCIASLAAVNRLDCVLFYLPSLLWLTQQQLKNTSSHMVIKTLLLGSLPIIAWETFAFIYYGFLLPNTAFAKLSTGISTLAYLKQGVVYVLDSLNRDPITLPLIAGTCIATWRSRNPHLLTFSLGILAYLAYTLFIGGDFMSGRFYAVPLFGAFILLTQLQPLKTRHALIIAIAMVGIISVSPHNTLTYQANYNPGQALFSGSVADERGFYYPCASLLNYSRTPQTPSCNFANIGHSLRKNSTHEPIVIQHSIGMAGYYAGPDVYIVDPYGLANPLLSHMPVEDTTNWRIGHFRRPLPQGYMESLQNNKNLIYDKRLAEYYDHINVITKGDLFSTRRFQTIIQMNLGGYNHLLKATTSETETTDQHL